MKKRDWGKKGIENVCWNKKGLANRWEDGEGRKKEKEKYIWNYLIIEFHFFRIMINWPLRCKRWLKKL